MAALGKAYIEVRADLATFPTELREKLKLALAEATQGVHFEEAEVNMDKAGREVADHFGDGLDEEVQPRAKKSGEKAGKSFFSGLKGVWGGLAAAFIPTLIAFAVELVAYLLPAVTALAAAIPAAGAVAIGAILPVMAAFHGLGAAIKGAFSPQATAAQIKALQNLTPAAKAFVLQLYNVRATLRGMQKDAQQAFFTALNPGLREALRLLPVVRTYFGQFAGDVGVFARNLLGGLSSNRSGFESILLGIHAVLSDLAPLGASLGRIFVNLAAVGLPFVDTLTRGFVNLTGRFSDFIDRAASSGALNDFFTVALGILRNLGAALGSIVRLVLDLSTVLGGVGGAGLTVLKQIVDQIDAFIKTAQGKAMLDALFTLLNTALSSLSSIVSALLPLVGSLATDLAKGLTQALIGLTPLLVATAKFLSAHPDLVKAAIAAWAAYRVALMMVAVAEAIVDALDPAMWIVLLVAAIILVAALIVIYWDKIKKAALSAWGAIKDAGMAVWHWLEGAAKSVGDWFMGVVHWFEDLPGKIGGFLASLPGLIGDAFKAAGDAALFWVGFAIGWVIGEFVTLPLKIQAVLQVLPGLIAQIWLDVWHWSVQHLEALGSWLGDFFAALPGRVWAWLSGLPGVIASLWESARSWTLQKLEVLGKDVGDFFRNLPGNLAHLLGSVGKAIGNFIIDGLNSAISGINHGIDAAHAGGIVGHLPTISRLAKGGIVSSPTLAMVGEGGGPEVVIPMNQPGRAQQLADESGLTQLLLSGLQAANVQLTVLAMLDTGDFIRIIDTRVTKGLGDEAAALTTGSKTGGF